MAKKYGITIFAALFFLACGNEITIRSDTQDQSISKKVDSVLSLMTLDEKIGQMVVYTTQWDVTGPVVSTEYEKYIREGSCGNVFNAHDVKFNTTLQNIAVNETRLGIPLLFGYDVIHGYRTIFPISLGESASWDLGLIEKASRIAAIEATANGVNWTFAPMVDLARDSRWGRVSESAGEDPYLGSLIAKARVKGFQGNDLTLNNTLLGCVKHFAAYGAPQAGRDYHTVDMSERMLREDYLPPYKAAIEENVASVMTSFNEYDAIPATGSEFLLTEILRNEWGFKGFVVTDYTAITEMIAHGVAANDKEAALLAAKAGAEMDMQSSAFREQLKNLVEEGKLSEKIINSAVRNILEGKFKLGLFEDPFRYLDTNREKEDVMTPEHLEAAYELACHSMVLLKNSSNVLPLKAGSDIAVVGPHAMLKRDLLGSWKADGRWDTIQTIYDAIAAVNKQGTVNYAKGCWFDDQDRSGFDDAVKAARKSDKIILLMGESWHWTGEAASRTSIELPGIQTDLITELSKLNKPMVLVLLNGRPLALEREAELLDAMLEAWFPGTMGAKAIADVLFGNFNPCGKITMTFPRNLGQIPIHYDMKNTGRPYDPEGEEQKYRSRYIDSPNDPLFPFGYGLSYTTFDYSDLKLNATKMNTDEELNLMVKVTNEGEVAGYEIVQLYIQDVVASVTRPVKELKGFRKIFLQPKESQVVTFSVTPKDLSFYRADMTFGTEPGEFKAFVGTNSRDVLETTFILE